MSIQAIARRYAKAAFDIGRETGKLGPMVEAFQAFTAVYRESPEFRELDHLPGLSDAQRAEVVRSIAARLGVADRTEVVRTVSLLAERQRLSVLPEVAELLSEMRDDHEGVLRVTIKSAKKLAPGYLARLTATIEQATGKKVSLEASEDPELICGVVAHIGDRVIDGSVRGRLDRLAASLRTVS